MRQDLLLEAGGNGLFTRVFASRAAEIGHGHVLGVVKFAVRFILGFGLGLSGFGLNNGASPQDRAKRRRPEWLLAVRHRASGRASCWRPTSPLTLKRMAEVHHYLVTGATSGIGKAVAERLVSRGNDVIGVGRRTDAFPKGVEAALVDLRDTSAVCELFARLEKRQVRLAGLVNAAGLALAAPLRDGDPADWEALWRVNVHALAVCCQEALRLLTKEGVIINISSRSGHRVPSSGGFYTATKFAVHAMSEVLRKELKAAGSTVRVATISPGFVETPMLDDYLRRQPGRQEKLRQQGALLQPSQVAEVILRMLDSPSDVEIDEVRLTARGQSS